VHRDTYSFVHEWRELAQFRKEVGADACFDGTCVAPDLRQSVFQAYVQHFKRGGLRPAQTRKQPNNYAEAHLRDIAASRHIAFVIFEVGLPKLTPAAEQRDNHSQQGVCAAEQRTQALEANTIAILEWLDAAARCILAYKDTASLKEAQRRAGTKRGVSGITQVEVAQRAELRSAQSEVRKGQRLADHWRQRTMTFWTMTWSDWAVLQNHWSGFDEQRLVAIQQKRGNQRITMPTLRRDLPQSQQR
jgi:hypothetical protein